MIRVVVKAGFYLNSSSVYVIASCVSVHFFILIWLFEICCLDDTPYVTMNDTIYLTCDTLTQWMTLQMTPRMIHNMTHNLVPQIAPWMTPHVTLWMAHQMVHNMTLRMTPRKTPQMITKMTVRQAEHPSHKHHVMSAAQDYTTDNIADDFG